MLLLKLFGDVPDQGLVLRFPGVLQQSLIGNPDTMVYFYAISAPFQIVSQQLVKTNCVHIQHSLQSFGLGDRDSVTC